MIYRINILMQVALSALAAILMTTGCGPRAPYEMAEVSGQVTIDGEPLTVGRVMFAPRATGDSIDAGKPAYGLLDDDGRYQLGTFRDSDGAKVGSHWVTIFGYREGMTNWPAKVPKFTRIKLRGDAKSVAGGQDNVIDFPLTMEDIKKFGQAYED